MHSDKIDFIGLANRYFGFLVGLGLPVVVQEPFRERFESSLLFVEVVFPHL